LKRKLGKETKLPPYRGGGDPLSLEKKKIWEKREQALYPHHPGDERGVEKGIFPWG